ncbi:dihydroneopterin aldolase [Galactobacter valiniphilus]|uniref:7,8-dihydroneopterin aldolase n=1 Tax=Galactobacter valiniphilus TaxID=2676122 RepID=A0A399JEF4_9MICC|nr:dihydroneopterin aldolase [Galactobacter valiniphilus]RII40986.1 dihydroneopterin aldolase [Galactobacter valiniphilus]
MAVSPAHDTITVTGITATGFHGVFEHEKRDGQTFRVDLTLHTSTRVAAASDDLRDTIDYGALAQAVVAEIEAGPYDLIEKLAGVIADRVLSEFDPAGVTVSVHKPQAPVPVPFDDVVITIHRERA